MLTPSSGNQFAVAESWRLSFSIILEGYLTGEEAILTTMPPVSRAPGILMLTTYLLAQLYRWPGIIAA